MFILELLSYEGELSSALEFLYTDKWVQVYSYAAQNHKQTDKFDFPFVDACRILRKSTNNVIVDEVDVLNGDQVLFHLNNGQNSVKITLTISFSLCY